MELEREINLTFVTTADPATTLALLGDVPEASRHMPDVARVEATADGHRWTMKKLGMGKVSHQAVYCSEFITDAANGTVTWGARRDLGNSWAHGAWTVRAEGTGAHVHLCSSFGVQMPVPAMLRSMALKVFEREYTRLMSAYCDHLKRTLDGGDGRLR